MHTLQKNAEEIRKLINGANEVTGIDDINLTDAVNSLIEKRATIRKNVADEFGIKTSAGGEQLLINDSSDMPPLGLKVYGKSIQNTVAGNQLLPYPYHDADGVYNGITFTSNNDGSVTIKGTATLETYIHFLKNPMNISPGTYTISLDGINNDGITVNGRYTYTTMSRLTFEKNNNVATATFTTSIDSTLDFLNIQIAAGTQVNTVINPMLNKGSTALPWEPYTGGIPSPNPDYPQAIHSLGEDGTIEYTLYGGNLFNVNVLTLHKDVSVEQDVITINKDTTDFYIWGSFNGGGTSFELKKGVYSLSSNHPNIRISMYYKDDGNIRALDSNAEDNTLIENASIHGIRIRSIDGTPLNKTPVTIILNIGSTKCGYMPYLPPQPLTLQTTNGLHGIPVSSGGNYTDSNGQQYIADYIDLETGKFVQNIAELYLGDGAKFSINGSTLVTNGYAMVSASFTAIANAAYSSGSLCNRFRKGSGYTERYSLGYRSAYLWISAERLNGENTTLDDVKEYVKNNPIRILAVRANPIETDLSEDEIAKFKALKMNSVNYDQFTTILNSENAYTEVHYIADADTYIENLTNSILTLGGEV